MFYGLLNLNLWGYVAYTLISTHITIAAVTIFLHRAMAHRALELHPIVSHFFRMWLWLTTGMETKAWTAIHRKHHAKCETAEDPHSPQMLGINKVLWQGADLYKSEALNQETLERFGKGTPDDWLERNIYKHSTYGIGLTLIINIILLGVPGITVWAIQMAWIPFFAAGVINGIGHYFGYRNYESPDAARNIVPWGILIGGEELHNNHHTFPTSAKLSNKWYEFDIGWMYIWLLSLVGLAKPKRLSPTITSVPQSYVTLDTVKAVLTGRFQLMSNYCAKVLEPIFDKEKSLFETKLSKRLKRNLVLNEALVDDQMSQEIDTWITKTKKLKIVYQFKNSLQEIWLSTTKTQLELVELLQEWCDRAENSCVLQLQEFANYVKGFRATYIVNN